MDKKAASRFRVRVHQPSLAIGASSRNLGPTFFTLPAYPVIFMLDNILLSTQSDSDGKCERFRLKCPKP